jgi:RHS repeat-associated protein
MGYQYDVNGRLNTLTSGGSTFATATYTAAGQLYQLSYGGLMETRTYNSMMQLIAQSVPGYLNMTYNYSPTQNNGRITSSVDGVTGENTSYSYDALNRLSAASNSLWSGSYAYDGFGNLTSKSGSGGSPNSFPSMTATYNSNNQLTTVSYDANGNTSSASGYWYGYTVENKLGSRTSQTWPYPWTLYGNDPSGRRVMKETNPDPSNYEGEDIPSWEFYFYTINGQRLATIDCNNANAQYQPNCWPVGENTYFGGKMLVSNGVYVVTDRLGSVRANTQGESFAYYPYGEERTNRPDGRDKFATYFRDTVGLDYADQRYYGSGMGSFFTPDSGGIKTADPTDPGSWNRYAYVEGDPINYLDPMGQARINTIAMPTYCGWQGGVLAPPGSENGWDNYVWSCQTGTVATVNVRSSAFPKCNPTGDQLKETNLAFLVTNWDDAVDVASTYHVSGDWILAWAAEESGSVNAQNAGQGWGTIAQAGPNQNNFLGETAGAWTNAEACGPGTIAKYPCFGSFYDSVSAAFTSFGGMYGTILSNAYAAGQTAAQAFQQVANKGWNPSSYGADIQSVLKGVDSMLGCLSTNGYLN